ncbi:hypothetical protein F5888DRAFT_1893422 [Russula emetica]|nr:hypothetical protein F5888DRAFT_1893422 [Russula emetica]
MSANPSRSVWGDSRRGISSGRGASNVKENDLRVEEEVEMVKPTWRLNAPEECDESWEELHEGGDEKMVSPFSVVLVREEIGPVRFLNYNLEKSHVPSKSVNNSVLNEEISGEWEGCCPSSASRATRIEKAREWFERAVSAGPDLGDAWGWWLKFEHQHGTAAQQEDVIVRCQAAEPCHCKTWQPIAKDDKNRGKSAEEI